MTRPLLPYHTAPPGLRDNIQAALRRSAARPRRSRLLWTAGLAATLLLATGTWFVGSTHGRADPRLVAVLDGHLRSLAPGHLTDVTSTDQHTVKPWFAGKLDFSPPVIDPAAEGFPLVGGRVDVIAGQQVAALVYSRRSHVINLFIRPSERSADSAPLEQILRGYNILSWSASGMQFWMTSDLNMAELQDLQRLLSTPPAGAGR